jgi:hypothetical protein
LKRWIKVGCDRKKGGGRKTKDPTMEATLFSWYKSMKDRGNNVTAKMIKEKAINITSCQDFIASKGWLDKFKIRYKLDISKESTATSSGIVNSSNQFGGMKEQSEILNSGTSNTEYTV